MTKRALTFFNTLERRVQDDYKECKKALLKQFHSPEDIAKHRTMLYTSKQEDEDLDTFLEKIEESFEELQTPDSTKIDILIASLRPELSYHLQLRQPRSYHEAVRYVQLKDALHKPQDNEIKNMMQKMMLQVSEQIKDLTIGNKKTITNHDIDAATLIRQNKQMKEQIQRMQQGNSFPNTMVNYVDRAQHGIDRKELRCFTCNQKGTLLQGMLDQSV